jgi:HK97 family phage prohead protease
MTTTLSEARLIGGLQLREVDTTDDLTWIEGMAVPYGRWANIGFFLEAFAPGSLGKSIKEAARALPINLFHQNMTFPIGSADSWKEEASGLRGVWKLDGSPEAQRAARAAKDGHLTGLSIEFQPIRSDWSWAEEWNPDLGPEGMDRVTRTEARLGAVALVPTPAYVEAGVTLVRAAPPARRGGPSRSATPALDAARKMLEELR